MEELRYLLEFIGYYHIYILDFSQIMKPLYDILHENKTENKSRVNNGALNSKQKVLWESHHQKKLKEATEHVQYPEVISYPDFSESFLIQCDSSQKVLGAVLYQNINGDSKRDMPCFKTAWKKSVFGVFLVRIFQHLDWIQKNAGMQNSEYAHILMRKITIYLHEN